MTEKQKSIPEDALDEKGKRKRYRERRPQMPFDQEVQKAAAVPIGRKTANFDYNKNRKERREKQLNSTKSKKMCLDESNPGDFSIFGSPLSVKKWSRSEECNKKSVSSIYFAHIELFNKFWALNEPKWLAMIDNVLIRSRLIDTVGQCD